MSDLLPGFSNPAHVHQFEDEYFYVQNGSVQVKVGGSTTLGEKGDLLFAPKGLPHQLSNLGEQPARLLTFLAPGHLEAAFRAAAGQPDQLKGIFKDYGIDFLEQWDPERRPSGWTERSGAVEKRSVAGMPSVWMAGDIYTPLLRGADTAEQFCLIHARVPPGGGPAPHLHRRDFEAFILLSGKLTLLAEDRLVEASEGEVVILPPKIPHAFRNTGEQEVEMLMLTAPTGFDRLIDKVSRPAGQGFPGPLNENEIRALKTYGPEFGIEPRHDLLKMLE